MRRALLARGCVPIFLGWYRWHAALAPLAGRLSTPRPSHPPPPLEQEPNHQVCQGGACSALLLEQLQLEQLLQVWQS